MLYLVLAILSNYAITILMRLSADKVSANLSMLATNYLACVFLGAVYADWSLWPASENGFATAVGLGILSGMLYLGGFVLQQKNVRRSGVVLTSMFMKLGLLVPMVLSVLLFGEVPTWMQIFGFCVATCAIVVINLKKEETHTGLSIGLFLLLVVGGSCNAMSKVYEVFGTPALSEQYLFYTFAVALLLCAGLAACKKERPGRREFIYGALIGIPNFFSAKFLLLSLTKLPAVVVYPSYSVAALLLITLTGVAVFRERLSKLQWAALGAIVAALILLNI